MCPPKAFSALRWFVGERTFQRCMDRPQDSLGLGEKTHKLSIEIACFSKSCSEAGRPGRGEPRVGWGGGYWAEFGSRSANSTVLASPPPCCDCDVSQQRVSRALGKWGQPALRAQVAQEEIEDTLCQGPKPIG